MDNGILPAASAAELRRLAARCRQLAEAMAPGDLLGSSLRALADEYEGRAASLEKGEAPAPEEGHRS